MFVPRYSESEAREAIAASGNWSEALRRLGLRAAGGNHRVLRLWAERWRIPTDHFRRSARRGGRDPLPLEEVLVTGSRYDRGSLNKRLYAAGLKERTCELCGQGEEWHGRPMSLILDHVNGIHDDNRLANLRIVCPNCAATLPTHCARNVRRPACRTCGATFRPGYGGQRYCSARCWHRSDEARAARADERRWKVARPTREQLLADLRAAGWTAVGAKYGVSDNAVRKWLRRYAADEEAGRR